MEKKLFFRLFLIILPILILVFLELILRLFDLNSPPPLFVENRVNGKVVNQLNQNFAHRYFDPNKVPVPGLYPETIEQDKGVNTVRIFALGGSTTEGFPFGFQVPYPAQLKYLLVEKFPQLKIEMVNAGISAINSFSVLDMLPEIIEQSPDMILIYMGHNEFYGAYGSGSTLSIGNSGSIIRFYLKIQKFHLVQLIKKIISQILTPAQQEGKRKTLMEQVIADYSIEFRSDKYQHTVKNFQDNLEMILEQCSTAGIPVFISNLISNIRDMPPFASKMPEDLIIQVRQKYDRSIQSGERLYKSGRYSESLEELNTAFQIDSSSAALWYKIGRNYLTLGNLRLAEKYLYGAKERDLIRFRASEEINALIEKVAKKYDCNLVDMHKTFRNYSRQQLIGNEILCDHLHPDLNGYYLMALAFYNSIENANLMPDGPNTDFMTPDHSYATTAIDWNIGLIRANYIMSNPPFQRIIDIQYRGDSTVYNMAHDYVMGTKTWIETHYAMADIYLRRGAYEEARAEFEAVKMFYPHIADTYIKMANVYKKEKRLALAEICYQQALERSAPTGMLYYQLALMQFEQTKLTQAMENMQLALNSKELDKKHRTLARYSMAGFLYEMKKWEEAITILEELVVEEPQFQSAQIFLKKIRSEQK
jgi:tetratricopeptide (TPR) repeat protein